MNKITSTWELYTNFGVSGDKMYNLIESTNVYLHNLDKNTITPVVIRNTEVEYSNGRKPYRYVINVEESKVKFRK